MSLHVALMAFMDLGAAPEARGRAWGELSSLLHAFVREHLPEAERGDEDFVGLVVDRVMAKAQAPSSAYRGEHGEKSARAWVATIVRNELASKLRRRIRHLELEREAAASREQEVAEEARRAERERRLREVTERIEGLCRSRVAVSPSRWNHYVPLVHEARWAGRTTEQLLVDRGYLLRGVGPGETFIAARDRYHKHLQRGRERVAELLAELVTAGDVNDDEDLALYVRFHGVPWPPRPRASKVSQ